MPIDPQSGMFYGEDTAKLWLRDNEGKWDMFLHRHKTPDRPALKKKMYEANPELSMSAVKDFFIPDPKKLERIYKFIETEWGIIIVAGGKDQGKTATCWWVLEKAHLLGRKTCIAGPPQKIPSWATRVMDPAAAPEGSVVYVTEAAVQFPARGAMRGGQQDSMSILPVIRHGDRLILWETQHTRIIDINLLRLMDGAILKPGGMYKEEERGPQAHIIDVLKPHLKTQTLFMVGQWFTLLKHQPLPECWSTNLSKSYKPIHDEKEAIEFGVSLIEQDYALSQVRRILLARSFNRPMWWWQEQMIKAIGGQPETSLDVGPDAMLPSATPALNTPPNVQNDTFVKRRLTKVGAEKNVPTTEMTDEQIKQKWGAS